GIPLRRHRQGLCPAPPAQYVLPYHWQDPLGLQSRVPLLARQQLPARLKGGFCASRQRSAPASPAHPSLPHPPRKKCPRPLPPRSDARVFSTPPGSSRLCLQILSGIQTRCLSAPRSDSQPQTAQPPQRATPTPPSRAAPPPTLLK